MHKTVIHFLFIVLATVTLSSCAEFHRDKGSTARDLVFQSQETIRRFKGMPDLRRFAEYIPTARGIVVLPTVIKGGLILGGEGGNGVLMVKRDDGTWSDPAFYILGAASLGLQAGIQDTEIVLVLRSDNAVDAVINHQGKLGADAGVTVGMMGMGAEVSTTANIGVDVLAFANSKIGLFGGAALEGAVLARRTDLNEAYYGQGATPKTILYGGQLSNPQANGLRQALGGE